VSWPAEGPIIEVSTRLFGQPVRATRQAPCALGTATRGLQSPVLRIGWAATGLGTEVRQGECRGRRP